MKAFSLWHFAGSDATNLDQVKAQSRDCLKHAFTTAANIDTLVASTASLPTTVHTLVTPADKLVADHGYLVAHDPIRIVQATTALILALNELKKRHPNLQAASNFANRAVMLIESAGGQHG